MSEEYIKKSDVINIIRGLFIDKDPIQVECIIRSLDAYPTITFPYAPKEPSLREMIYDSKITESGLFNILLRIASKLEELERR